MRIIVIIYCLGLVSFHAFSQEESNEKTKTECKINEFIPEFIYKNGSNNLLGYINDNLIYPEYAYKNKIAGRVYVQFTVDFYCKSKNKVLNVFIIKGVHPSLDFAAKKLIEDMPNWWRSTRSRGKDEPTTFVIPVRYDPENIKPEQVKNIFDKKIEKLILLDSLTLDSILYRKKEEPAVKEIAAKESNDSILLVSEINREQLNSQKSNIKINTKTEEINNDCSEQFNKIYDDNSNHRIISGRIILDKDYANIFIDSNKLEMNGVDISLSGEIIIHPNSNGCFIFPNLSTTNSNYLLNFSFNPIGFGIPYRFEKFEIPINEETRIIRLPDLHCLDIYELTPDRLLWEKNLDNRFKNRKMLRVQNFVLFLPRFFTRVFVNTLIRNNHYTYKNKKVKLVYQSIKVKEPNKTYKFVLDGKYRKYYDTGESYIKGRIIKNKCVGIWNVYNKKGEIIAGYDFTKSKTIYQFIGN